METENWNPGHTVDGGFPHEAPASLLFYKNRPKFFINAENKVELELTDQRPTSYPEPNVFETFGDADDMYDFLFNRCHQAHEALALAENQIRDILREFPFSPGSFGFELAHSPKSIHDAPIRIYISKYSPEWSLYRKPHDTSISQSKWILKQKLEHGRFNDIEVDLPCARIAYATLWSLGLKLKDSAAEREKAAVPLRKYEGTHTVWFRRYDSLSGVNIDEEIDVTAETDQAALVKAKFLLETDEDHAKSGYYRDIEFSELSILPRFEKHPDIPAQG